MKVDIYDFRDNCINTIENVIKIICCKDGRHLITTKEQYTTQVPARYMVEVKC